VGTASRKASIAFPDTAYVSTWAVASTSKVSGLKDARLKPRSNHESSNPLLVASDEVDPSANPADNAEISSFSHRVGSMVGSAEGNGVGCGDGSGMGFAVGSAEGSNEDVGSAEGLRDGRVVGWNVGRALGVGIGGIDGLALGAYEGEKEYVGATVGDGTQSPTAVFTTATPPPAATSNSCTGAFPPL
jgi:hypothetical protein